MTLQGVRSDSVRIPNGRPVGLRAPRSPGWGGVGEEPTTSRRARANRKGRNNGRPKNPTERQFFDSARAEGWEPTKRGWPDFFIERDGEIALVEVKPAGGQLKASQHRILTALAAYGVPCYLWTPDRGFERVT